MSNILREENIGGPRYFYILSVVSWGGKLLVSTYYLAIFWSNFLVNLTKSLTPASLQYPWISILMASVSIVTGGWIAYFFYYWPSSWAYDYIFFYSYSGDFGGRKPQSIKAWGRIYFWKIENFSWVV